MPGKPGHSGRPPKNPIQPPSGVTPETPAEHPTKSDSSPPKKRGRPPKKTTEVPECEDRNKTDEQVTQPTTTEPCPQVTQRKLRPKTDREVFKDSIIGKPLEFLPMTKLPVKRQILQCARGLRDLDMLGSRNRSDEDIAKTIALEVHQIWTKAALPCWRIDEIQKLVRKCMDELASLMKHWS